MTGIKFQIPVHRRNADITDIVYLYFWEFEHEIRAFVLKKFINEV